MSDKWTPVEDNTPNSFNQQLDTYVKAGAPVDAGPWAFLGCFVYLGFALIPAIPIGFLLWLWNLLETGNIINP